ncbi:MAG: hypothetical protein KDD55_04510 [Bdellovibrionales bacterium]|nr:hypothetical protein [Bdellovibrionales bacterium]
MTSTPLFKEFLCTSLTRAGAKKIIQLFQELNICSYWGSFEWTFEARNNGLFPTAQALGWLGNWVPCFQSCSGLTYPDPIGVKVSHHFDGDTFTKPMIRPVRDARDSTVSNYDRLAKHLYNTPGFTPECFLDMPLVPSQGGIFQLGMIEEWLLQEYLIRNASTQVAYLYYEKLENLDTSMIEGILSFMGVSRTNHAIQSALSGSRSDKFNESHSTGEKISVWRNNKHPAINARYHLLAPHIPTGHDYPLESAPAKQPIRCWNEDTFNHLLRIWIETSLEGISKKFGGIDISSLVDPMVQLAIHIEHLPLLQFYFARHALREPSLRKDGLHRLHSLALNSSPFIKLLAANTLLLYGDPSQDWKSIKQEYFQGLSPRTEDKRHFQELCKLFSLLS